ncbi:MAG: UPF0280 family protein [Geminicoccaceae bacterium]
MGASAVWLPDGKRLHFQHGPIDLIIEASGSLDSVDLAYRQAWKRFQTVLEELAEELPRLRTLCPPEGLGLTGTVARRMERASQPHAGHGVTAMVAVAGAVADEILEAMLSASDLDRAYVNNGGDIAVHLGEGERFEIAVVGTPAAPIRLGNIGLRAGDPAGIATSGRHGRSFSLGIADSVTVLAENAAAADAAATLIANAVDLPESPLVKRVAARDLEPESDLGDRLVTVDVQALSPGDVRRALASGADLAQTFLGERTIAAALLCLDDGIETVGDWPGEGCTIEFSRAKALGPPRQADLRPL